MKITRGYFNSYRISDSNIITESYRRTRYFSSSDIRSGACTTVFISHKHSDLETAGDMNELKGLLSYLKKEYHIDPYIDSMDKKMPNETCVETAERIKEIINYSQKFILLATNAAIASKWCNWEVGIADKLKLPHNDMAIMPMLDEPNSLYKGNEYLELYPFIEERNFQISGKCLGVYIRTNEGRKWITLKNWLENRY